MDVIYTLIPVMIVMGVILVGLLIWTIRRGDYEDLEGEAHRILLDEDEEMMPDELRQPRRTSGNDDSAGKG